MKGESFSTLFYFEASRSLQTEEKGTFIYQRENIPDSGFAGGTGALRTGEVPVSKFTSAETGSFAQYNDAAIVVFARASGEGADIPTTVSGWLDHEDGKSPLSLSNREKEVVEFAKQNFDNVIVVVNSANALEIKELKDDPDVDAIVWIGLPGLRGLEGVAEVLSGNANFSGGLPQTYAADSRSAPALVNSGDIYYANADEIASDMGYSLTNETIPAAQADRTLTYAENIYVGYLYYETRYEDYVLNRSNAESDKGSSTGSGWTYEDEVAYSFGDGLSYTTFTKEFAGEPEVTREAITFNVKVTNAGDVEGKTPVQIYAQSPYTAGGIEKAAVQLLTFDKTKELDPGASETLTITVPTKYLASYDDDNAETYVLDNGTYYFGIGNGAHEALNNILAEKGSTPDNTAGRMTAAGNAEMVATWEHNNQFADAFSVSDYGTSIKNRFDYANYNNQKEDTVTYLTRNDWSGTWPRMYDNLVAPDSILPTLQTYDYKVSDSDTSAATYGKTGDIQLMHMRGVDYDDVLWTELVQQLTLDELAVITRHDGAGTAPIESVGWIGSPLANGEWDESAEMFPGAGFPAPLAQGAADGQSGMQLLMSATLRISDDADPVNPYTIRSDSPWAEYSLKSLHSQTNVAATFSRELAREQGKLFGNDSLWSNEVSGSWSIGLNIHRTPFSGRNHEYLSEDPMLSNILACETRLTHELQILGFSRKTRTIYLKS
jgi:beta-glucosidase